MELLDFKAYVKRDLKRTDKDTELVQAYNDMIRWIAIKMPVGDYKFQSYVTTSTGIEDYELPCDLLHLLHPIRLLDGSASTDRGYPLTKLTKEQYDIWEPNPNRNDPTAAKPSCYTIFSRSILLTPIPNASTYVLEINWGKKPTTLANDTDVSSLGSEYDEVLKWGTLERIYAGMQRYDEAQYWGSKYHDQDDNPAGCLLTLLQTEVSREGEPVSIVNNNNL